MKTTKKTVKIISRTLFTYAASGHNQSKQTTDPTTSTITTPTVTGGMFNR